MGILENDWQARSLGFLTNQIARFLTNSLAQALQPLGLAPAQFATLLQLWREEGLTQRDLVARLQIEQATMASTLDRMERDGLIRRQPHPQDGRVQSIILTPRSRKLQAAAQRAATEVNQNALSVLNSQEQEQLLTLNSRVLQHLRSRRSLRA
jgi:DNA-binding MarR family transcriptional regulator